MQVIKGNLKEKEKKLKEKKEFLHKKYEELFRSNLAKINQYNINKTIYFGVKYVCGVNIYKFETEDDFFNLFRDIVNIHDLVSLITFNDFMKLFPVEKDYIGYKFGCKDYWSTKEFLNDFNLNDFIDEKSDELFMEYFNFDIINFSVKSTILLDKIRRLQGERPLLDVFLDTVDPEGKIQPLTYYPDEGFMLNPATGKTFKVSKPKKRKPSYLNVVR